MQSGKKIIDFRSDTITTPTSSMREAMFQARVGDDVYGEDPTVIELEKTAAQKLGKEEALFVSSGTQGNLIAVLTHTKRGDEVILEADSHIYYYEVGGISALGGVIPRLIKGEGGVFSPETVYEAVRPDNIHYPNPSLLCLENTHNRGGGEVWTVSQIRAVSDTAREEGLKVHMDGARVFNAAVSLGCDVKELVKPVDSVMFCLSKGLGAPVGSLLVGSKEFVRQARKYRKMLGGGMRQVGVLAAAGLVALNEMVDRLAEDHVLAEKIGRALNEIPGLTVDLSKLKTNIVIVNIDPGWGDARTFLNLLKEEGILAVDFGPQAVRFVTHKDVNTENAEGLLNSVKKIMKG